MEANPKAKTYPLIPFKRRAAISPVFESTNPVYEALYYVFGKFASKLLSAVAYVLTVKRRNFRAGTAPINEVVAD